MCGVSECEHTHEQVCDWTDRQMNPGMLGLDRQTDSQIMAIDAHDMSEHSYME